MSLLWTGIATFLIHLKISYKSTTVLSFTTIFTVKNNHIKLTAFFSLSLLTSMYLWVVTILECLASSCITLVDMPFSLKLVMNVLLPECELACWILASLYKLRKDYIFSGEQLSIRRICISSNLDKVFWYSATAGSTASDLKPRKFFPRNGLLCYINDN